MPENSLEFKVSTLDSLTRNHGKRLHQVESDVFQLRLTMANTATKDDVSGLKSHIDETINEFMKTALQIQPVREANRISKSGMLATWIAAGAAILRHL